MDPFGTGKVFGYVWKAIRTIITFIRRCEDMSILTQKHGQRFIGSGEAFACVLASAIAVDVLEPAFRGDPLRMFPHGMPFISSFYKIYAMKHTLRHSR